MTQAKSIPHFDMSGLPEVAADCLISGFYYIAMHKRDSERWEFFMAFGTSPPPSDWKFFGPISIALPRAIAKPDPPRPKMVLVERKVPLEDIPAGERRWAIARTDGKYYKIMDHSGRRCGSWLVTSCAIVGETQGIEWPKGEPYVY